MQARFPIGLSFKYYARKHNNQMTIVDIYTTRNAAGDVVRLEYLVAHEFLGQQVTELMVDPSIARSLTNEQLQIYIK